MSYTYEYTYPKNGDNNTIGYSGPMPLEIGTDNFVDGIKSAIDKRSIVRASIQRILGTSKGERVMQPRFGSNLKNLLFDPNDNFLLEDIKETLQQSIQENEPRVIVKNIDINTDKDNHIIYIALNYSFRADGTEDSFNFTIK